MRRKIGFIIGLLAVSITLEGALWLVATRQLAQSVGAFEKQMRADGWRVKTGAPIRSGWPFQALLALPSPSLEGGERSLPGGLSWRADRLLIGLSLLHPFTLRLLPQGHEELRLSRAPPVVFSADRLQALVPLGEARPSHIAVEARVLAGGLAASPHQQDVRLASLSLHLADHPPGKFMPISAALDIEVSELDLPDTRRWPLGARIGRLRLRAELTSPPLPEQGVEPGSGAEPGAEKMDAEAQARAWRDGGGRLTVQDLALHWGPLNAEASADLGLDHRLQPSGSGRALLTGYDASLDALAGGGAISTGLAATAKVVLGLMAPSSGAGGVSLPFALQDSTLSVGKIPVVRLSDVLWKKP